jgi:Sec-independent protein translocase protein TatA
MLDNFGLGEFFFLALLALLFFGPERLPQMGARLGRWVGNLTQYSKAFMTEWHEEALAIHDAVAEVKGIRDEIVAAQRELSGTMNTAREDMIDGIDTAKSAVSDAAQDVTSRIQQQRLRAAQDFDQLGDEPGSAVSSEAGSDGSGTTAAVAKTQQVLADLQERRSAAGSEETWGASAALKATASETAAEAVDQETPASSPEEERERIRRLIEEGIKPKQPKEGDEVSGASIPGAAIPPSDVAERSAPQPDTAAAEGVPEKEAPAPPRETAFDRTQQVLETLRKRRAGITEEPSAATGAVEETKATEGAGAAKIAVGAQAGVTSAPAKGAQSPPPTKETAFDRTQQVLENLKKRRDQVREAAAPAKPASVSRDDFERLTDEVLQLRGQMEALRNEIQTLRALARRESVAMDDVSIEEVA